MSKKLYSNIELFDTPTNDTHIVNKKYVDPYVGTFTTDGESQDYYIQHNLGKTDIVVYIYDSDNDSCFFTITTVDDNNVKIHSDVVIQDGITFRVVIK